MKETDPELYKLLTTDRKLATDLIVTDMGISSEIADTMDHISEQMFYTFKESVDISKGPRDIHEVLKQCKSSLKDLELYLIKPYKPFDTNSNSADSNAEYIRMNFYSEEMRKAIFADPTTTRITSKDNIETAVNGSNWSSYVKKPLNHELLKSNFGKD
ncbi:uncharacterized protein L201_001396 [Kwoniella dendrophila CBS 6074]|uniref:Uncharacterized protein n=1 Tax=Kwoniella dendrophila CBS 6074 TaxID=1295534 RepID=A0AAX4JM98_9TREE